MVRIICFVDLDLIRSLKLLKHLIKKFYFMIIQRNGKLKATVYTVKYNCFNPRLTQLQVYVYLCVTYLSLLFVLVYDMFLSIIST